MKKSVVSIAGAAIFGVVALGIATSSAALADPSPAGNRTYTTVGSDTIQDVWNGLSNGVGAPSPSVASYDAFGTPTITFNGVTINRPAGSGDGVKAVSASADPANHNYAGPTGLVNVAGKIQFARSSAGAAANGTDLTYLPFARDAVSVLLKTSAAGTVNVTTAQLTDIYKCVPGANKVTVVNGTSSTVVTVNPKLPQASSGTRKFFLGAISVATPGTCVATVGAENNGGQLTTAGDLIPFSAGQYIAQKNGATGTSNTISSTETLASVNSQNPTVGTTKLAPGALFGSPSVVPTAAANPFARDTFNVVSTADYLAKGPLVTTILKSDLTSLDATDAITTYGFLNLSYVGNPEYGTGSAAANLLTRQGLFQH